MSLPALVNAQDDKEESVDHVELHQTSDETGNSKVDYRFYAVEKKRLSRKIDLRLIPILSLIYSFSVIDRINIGQAKVVGMTEDLSMTSASAYSICLLVFFPAYMLAELPGNMALVKFGVANALAFIMLGLGVSTIAQGHVQHWSILAVCRVLVGAFEATVFPAMIYLVSSWYVRYEAHRKLAWMYSIGIISSAFAGVLAYALALLDGKSGWRGWRWIFTVEGSITAAFAVPTWLLVVDFPDRAKFLSPRQRQIKMEELTSDRGDSVTYQITWENIKDLKDWTIWLVTFMYMCNVTMVYGLAFFVPTILTSMGYTGLQANLHSAPPYAVAAGVLWVGSYIADKTKRRLPLIIVQTCLAILGLALMSQNEISAKARYAGICFAIAGAQANNSAILIFGQNNIVGSSKSSVATVLNIAGGTIGGLLGSTIYLQREAPDYITGLSVTMALAACLVLSCAAVWPVLAKYNSAADRGEVVFHDLPAWRWTL
ncbi:uncharacterized protein Z518_03355 [Rhinocladiella mackenziei CBS 650.93]|uniref:Major facilitator superfamily (MFS) profile domain-containing protein n=1 Tax=Rhinocladiella mackenziei CBS 650.93 TaxID=1442369 RepID=A0A0D2HDR4_9EURO|nr:uncharacterized protein Z518_03355 [Rhinocladiella mackenziei CBS 650.93]KIX08698.1 hypothetical protein Z518_03355 [Rhinocladiella mackenziei CBS 650.93]